MKADKTDMKINKVVGSNTFTVTIGGVTYQKDTLLGKGAFGSVYKMVPSMKKDDGLPPIAIKIETLQDDVLLQKIQQENDLVAKMMGTQTHGVKKHGKHIYSALPLLNSGDLTNFIKKGTQNLRLTERAHILLELSDQLAFMHSKTKGLYGSLFSGYIHSDLKTDNVMLSNEGVALSAYLIDFGLSYSWMSKDAKVLPQGSPLYMPPEIFQPTNQNPKDIPKIDIYSLTAIFAKLLGIKNPVKEKYKHRKYNYTAVAKTPFSLDEAFSIPEIHNKPVAQERVRAFLKRMGSFNPKDRPSSEEVLMFSKSLYNYSTSMELIEILDKPHQTITESIDDLLVAKGLYTKDYLGKVTENIAPFMEAPSKLKEVLIYDILMEKTKEGSSLAEDDLSVITKRTVKLLKAKHSKIGALIKGIKGGSNEQYKKSCSLALKQKIKSILSKKESTPLLHDQSKLDNLLVIKGLYVRNARGQLNANTAKYLNAPDKQQLIIDILIEGLTTPHTESNSTDRSIQRKKAIKAILEKDPKIRGFYKSIKSNQNNKMKLRLFKPEMSQRISEVLPKLTEDLDTMLELANWAVLRDRSSLEKENDIMTNVATWAVLTERVGFEKHIKRSASSTYPVNTESILKKYKERLKDESKLSLLNIACLSLGNETVADLKVKTSKQEDKFTAQRNFHLSLADDLLSSPTVASSKLHDNLFPPRGWARFINFVKYIYRGVVSIFQPKSSQADRMKPTLNSTPPTSAQQPRALQAENKKRSALSRPENTRGNNHVSTGRDQPQNK